MIRTLLSDDEWKKVEAILPGKEGDRGRTAIDNRWFLEAVPWIGRTGSQPSILLHQGDGSDKYPDMEGR